MWADENYAYSEAEGILYNYGIRSVKKWGNGIRSGLIFVKGFHAEFFLSEEDIQKEADSWTNFFINPNNFRFLLESTKNAKEEMALEFRKLIQMDLSKMDNSGLFYLFDFYNMKFGRLMNCYIATQPHRVAGIENKLKNYLKMKNAENHFLGLVKPEKRIIFSEHGNKFFNESLAELSQNSKIDFSLAYHEMYSEEDEDSSEKYRIMDELNFDEEARNIVKVLSEIGPERFKMRFVWMPAVYFRELFLIELKRRFNLSKEELRLYLDEDLKELIFNNKKLDEGKLETRKKGFLKFLDNGLMRSYEGEEAEIILGKLVEKVKQENELKGNVAFAGKVLGRVVILSYKESENHVAKIKEMKEGDILITEMTRPNIIEACKKASAIVTDEGGILCHAAIVAREFKIPCVIGTKRATTNFKDGDLVEVDANKGIVRKIS